MSYSAQECVGSVNEMEKMEKANDTDKKDFLGMKVNFSGSSLTPKQEQDYKISVQHFQGSGIDTDTFFKY